METIILRKHFDHLIQCTEKLPLSAHSLRHYTNHYERIFLYCCENHLDFFSYQDASAYCSLKCPSPKPQFVKESMRSAYIVARYFDTEMKRQAVEKASEKLPVPAMDALFPAWEDTDIIGRLVRGY